MPMKGEVVRVVGGAHRGPSAVTRRDFVRMFSAGGSFALAGGWSGLSGLPGFLQQGSVPAGPGDGWNPLRRTLEARPQGLTLLAQEGVADIGGGVQAPAWMLNGSLPSPLLRVRRGERFQVTLANEIKDELILHWHGLTPPEHSDGHPRLAVHRGQTYDYDFTVNDRAGTYWYHSHAHMLTARHTYRGIAGMILVHDDEEDALGLPSGEREIPVVLQDRTLDEDGRPVYTNPNDMAGQMGGEPFGNGIHRPHLDVDTALYRFRVLNGSNARIFRVERSDQRPLVLIGNDGGLLERPLSAPFVDMAPGERIDMLLDFRELAVGEQVMLRSRAFTLPVGMDVTAGVTQQGSAMDLLRIRVARAVADEAVVPERLVAPPLPDPTQAAHERTFRMMSDRDPMTRSIHMRHRINGKAFEMDRVDEHVPFGQTEIWSFVNDRAFSHPIHLHGTHFRVLSRSGGRGEVMPWEGGLKDTVLLHPEETVRVAVRFDAHPGLFVLHCHNLEHEDVGMMLNVMVE